MPDGCEGADGPGPHERGPGPHERGPGPHDKGESYVPKDWLTGAPRLDPKGEIGKTKPQLQLIPPALNEETAKALSVGAARYGPWNWRDNPVELMTYVGAIRRHLDAFVEGIDIDIDGAHQLGCISANCAILLDARRHGTLVDNRPPCPPRSQTTSSAPSVPSTESSSSPDTVSPASENA